MTEPESSTVNQPSQAARLYDRYLLGLVLFITAFTYLGTVRFGFVYDDQTRILSNPFIRSWQYVPGYFVKSVWKYADALALGNYYRPLFVLWLRLNYSVFAVRPLGWHLTTVLLHLLVTWLVYLVVRKMTGRTRVAWLTALIFGVHPIHHEVVAWISGSTESLSAALFLAAFLGYLRSSGSSKTVWMSFSCVFYALGLLSNETAIVLPILVFAHYWIAGGSEQGRDVPATAGRSGQSFARIAVYIPVALIYLMARYKVLSGLSHPMPNVSFSTWLLTLPSVLFFYVKNWFLPIHLSEFYDLPYQVRPNLAHVILPAFIVLASACAIWIFRDRLGSRDAGYAAIWIIIPLLPALNIFLFNADELAHDRYFYVPSIGAALLVSLVIERAGKTRRAVFGEPLSVILTALALTVVLATFTTYATKFWRDDFTLFTRAHEIAPHNSAAINNLSVEWMNRGELEQAEMLLETGLQENRQDFRFALNLGRVMYVKKQYAKAEEFTRQALALDPNVADPYVSLGKIELRQNRLVDAENSMRRAVEINPFNAGFHTVYGIVLELNTDCAQAMIQFKAALRLSPGDFFSQREMSRCATVATPASTPGIQPARH
jgi:Tfp pilus assembly protein PilF